jgi:hypothetical protein
MSELNNEFGIEQQKSAACFSLCLWLFHWTPSSDASTTRTISPETAPQASDQPGENVSPPTPRAHGKSNDSFKLEDNYTEGVSFLTDAYTQFANKPIQDCIKDGFPLPFLRCQISRAPESSKICANCGIR